LHARAIQSRFPRSSKGIFPASLAPAPRVGTTALHYNIQSAHMKKGRRVRTQNPITRQGGSCKIK